MSPEELPAPSADDAIEDQADWIELRCVSDEGESTSLSDLIRQLRRSGTVERDAGSEQSERLAEDVFSELDSRAKSCGEDRYPFELDPHGIRRRQDFLDSPYIFQLLLTHFGIVTPSGIPSPEKVFEEISAFAAGRYFGGEDPMAFAFGFPRRYEHKNFHDALNNLCLRLEEGEGASLPEREPERTERLAKILAQKDGGLDVVAWKQFPDRRAGKLVGFGQCACGKADWRTKFTSLQPSNFFNLWLRKHFAVSPVRMFFVPRRVEQREWSDIAIQAGVLFDRCRITHHANGLSQPIVGECRAWIDYMLSDRKRTPPRKGMTNRDLLGRHKKR
jgi:hypothetical protein